MPYVTLQEAAQIVNHQTGVDITAPQLIRFAANSGLPLCVLLNVRCYSPTKTTRRENKAAELDPDYWSKPHADDMVLDDAYGLYVLPPRHVFDYQSKDAVYIDYVTSLDGLDTFKPGTDVSRDALQITLMHLNKFIAHIAANQPVTAPETANPAPVMNKDGSTIGGLSTSDIAETFDGLNDWQADRWTKNLSASSWLHHARISLGLAGGVSAVWNPLLLAQLIHDREKDQKQKERLLKALNSRFKINPLLMPWRDAFSEYFATNCMTD